MENLDESKTIIKTLVNVFLAEQQMLYHTQISTLVHQKIVKSAIQLYTIVKEITEIPDSLKNQLDTAINKRDRASIIAISEQIQRLVNAIRSKNSIG
jgi:hypothetical protein